MDLIDTLKQALGETAVLTGPDADRYRQDWTGKYTSHPVAVVRPTSTAEVQSVVRAARQAGVPVVPVAGNTGLNGGTHAEGALMLSLERMNRIEEIRPGARLAIVQSGVVLSKLHDAVEDEGLVFPLTFGARGSAMIGGVLSTNAGGSNVLRYGSTRGLCLGLEVVLPSGEILDLMSELHKDNSGYALMHMFIGAEGTLGIITRAVLKLAPKPAAYATAMLAVPSLDAALGLLNDLQEATGGAVEAFEYMPRRYMDALLAHDPETRAPFEAPHEINILVEVGATAPRDATPAEDGTVPIVGYLEEVLGRALEDGRVVDAVVAQSEAQRAEMWARREKAAEVSIGPDLAVNADVAVPLDKVGAFEKRAVDRLAEIDPDARTIVVAHLGDGNLHFAVRTPNTDPEMHEAIQEMVEDVVADFRGSFSAEHGIGLKKLPSMRRRKDPVAIELMRSLKATIDPEGLMNPGKVVPD